MRLSLLVVVGLTACNGVIQNGSSEEGPCVPALSTAELCLQAGAECGELETTDDCGVLVTLPSCGACTSPLECGVGGVANVCNEPGGFIIVEALALDRTVVRPGETLSASVTYANTSDAPITFESLVIAARPPGGTPGGGPFEDLQPQLGATTVAAGDQITLNAQRTFSSSDPEGEWYAYATYLDGAGAWHGGNQVTFTFAACTPETEICGDGIDQDCTGDDLACPVCDEGAIDSRCDCGGAVHADGYCCATVWQSVACSSCTPETEICGDGIDQDCTGDDLPCPVCADGPASATRCTCAGEILTDGFCCGNQTQTTECPPPVLDTSIVPAASRTVWDPGIPGGVPPDDANPALRQDGVGPAIQHGATIAAGASASTIQAALDAAGEAATKTSRRYVQLGAGTFNLGSELSIPSYVILRGTSSGIGDRQTILRQTFTGSLIGIWGAGSQGSWGSIRNVVGVAYKGASQITVDDASNFSVGDILTIDQLNDGSYSGSGSIVYDPPNAGNWIWYLSSLWYQRQAYSTGNGTGFLFPDSDGWRHTSERVEVLAKDGNTLTIWNGARGEGKPLHLTYYKSPQIYRCAGSNGDVRRYAGVEDLVIHPSGNNGQRVIALNGAAYSWVKNVEIDGSAQSWSGRHCQLYSQTYRCEVRDSYFHESGNYNQGGNAYGINVSGTNNLIENNVVRQLNKPIVMEDSNGGNVVAYNYVDEAVIGSLNGDWQEAAISTHASFCHHELFEGNWTPNIGPDSTHGNNGFNTIFRNWVRGQNTNANGWAYRRAIFSDGWQMDLNSIGNVLWYPGGNPDNLITASRSAADAGNANGIGYTGVTQSSVYLIGSNAWTLDDGNKPGADNMDDGTAWSHFHRHLDYDYFSNTQYTNPSNPVTTLPDSLYLQEKPAFFGSLAWPWVTPAGSSHAERVWILPAKARYDAGVP